jgi:dTDP-4-dehydro-6-deoxy-alpha-D-glucopyranose 2,3-dehydratase
MNDNSLRPAQGVGAGVSSRVWSAICRSRLTEEATNSDRFVSEWLHLRRAESRLALEQLSLRELAGWLVDQRTGNICHRQGKFFSVTGITVRHRTKSGELSWDQPIIDQPEVGILGILAKEIRGVLHFCLQAKEEPGNIGGVQLSPTVQATYSNYTRAHGGSRPPFVEYFFDPPRDRLLFAKLQTEDGGRFLYKSNRNMIILVAEDELTTIPRDFVWLTLRQIGQLLKQDNLIHACTRSVLAALIASVSCGASPPGEFAEGLQESLQWLDDQKAANHFLVKREGLNTLQEWWLDEDGFFSHREKRFFQVKGIRVSTPSREVQGWSQPILVNPEVGVIGLLVKKVAGELYFLLQAKAEPGNRTAVQLGPTVQFTPGNYVGNEKLAKPFLFDEFNGNGRFRVLSESLQAEEGARFFHETHRHRVLELAEGETLSHPAEYHWLSAAEVAFFLNLGDQVNSCARSVLTCLI